MSADYHVEIERIVSALGDRIYVRTRTFPDGVVVTDTHIIGPGEPPLSFAPDWTDDRGKEWPQAHCEGAGRANWADPIRRDRLA